LVFATLLTGLNEKKPAQMKASTLPDQVYPGRSFAQKNAFLCHFIRDAGRYLLQ
jgi:hypothetical protein